MDWYHGLTSIRQNVIHKRKFYRNIQREFMGHQGCVFVECILFSVFFLRKRKVENEIWCLMIVEPKHSLQKLRINFFFNSSLIYIEYFSNSRIVNWVELRSEHHKICVCMRFFISMTAFPWFFLQKKYIFWLQRCFNDD